nr:hypothetical protein [Tanacetum cinerariifolium]
MFYQRTVNVLQGKNERDCKKDKEKSVKPPKKKIKVGKVSKKKNKSVEVSPEKMTRYNLYGFVWAVKSDSGVSDVFHQELASEKHQFIGEVNEQNISKTKLDETVVDCATVQATPQPNAIEEQEYHPTNKASVGSDDMFGPVGQDHFITLRVFSGADRSFVSTTFIALIDITPTTLENHYDIELANGKTIGVNTIIRGCTLNFMNHPFNIDLMPVPLGSFDAIIGMDWLTKYHGVIICDEKIVRVPFGREMGCDVFLAHITMKEAKDKSEGKRLEDVPIVRDFPKVFPKDLPGIPPARQVEFQIDLVPGSSVYSKIDLRSVYHQFRVREEDILKITFRMRYGHYEFEVMPFGLTNANAVFIDLMNRVCKPYLDKFVIVVIDDILIYSNNKEEHEGHFKLILELLKK